MVNLRENYKILLQHICVSLSLLFLPLFSVGCVSTQEGDNVKEFTPSLTFHYDPENFINYEKRGSGNTPLILLHGFGSSLRNWDDVVANLAEKGAFKDRFTLYALDLKGAGFSSKPRDGHYAIKDSADIVISFLKELNIKHPVIVGHSLGGGVALYTTVHLKPESPCYPSRLILVDAACYPTEYPFFVKFLRVPIFNKLLLNGMPDEYRARRTLELVVADKSIITPEILHRYSYAYKMDNYDYVLIQTAKQIAPENIDQLISGYRNIECQTTILWGQQDSVLLPSLGEALKKDIPNSELFVYDDYAHALPEEAPAVVADAIIGKPQEHNRGDR